MAEQLVNGEHPLALELKSLRAAVGRFQEEAHASALKLQRHSLDVSKVQQRAVQLERENEVLRSELHVLRATPHPDADPSSPPSTQIQELTLSLRRLSHKLTLTEESLLSKTTELVTTHANLTKSRAALEEAYALGARVRGREEAGLARERNAEWKVRRLEEEKKMTDGVLGEYARLVRTLEARLATARTSITSPTTPDTPGVWKENGHVRTSSASSISDPLSSSFLAATFNLKQLTSQFQSENEELHRQIERLRMELEVSNSKLEGEEKGEKTVLAEFGRAKTELEKLRIEDGSAAKMVARYMQFSQSSTNTLLNTLSALKTRHAATLATLSEQNNELSLQRKSLESENSVLRDRLDEVGAELAKEVYGRRREVGLRIKMGGREEGVREGLGRWVRRGEEALKRQSIALDGEARESEEVHALLAMSQDARILLASLDEGLFDAETALTASGAKARGILLEAGLGELLDELKAETERKAKAEYHLIELKAMVAKVSAAMDEGAAIAGQETDDDEDLAQSLQDSIRNSIPVYPDEPPQPPPKAFDRLVGSKTQPEEKVEEPPALSSGLALITGHDTPPSTNTANDTFITHDTATDAPSSSTVRPHVSPDPEIASSVPPSSDDGHMSTSDALTDIDKPGTPTPNEVAHFIPEPSTFIPISAEPPLPEAAEPDDEPAVKVPPPAEVEVEIQVDAPVVVPTISVNLEITKTLQPTEDTGCVPEVPGATDLEQETTAMAETAGLDKGDMQQAVAISTVSFPPSASSSSVIDIANQEDEDQPRMTTGPTDNTNTVAFPTAAPAAPAPPLSTDPAPKLGDRVVPPSIAEKTLPDAPAPSVGELPPEFPPVVLPTTVPIVALAPLEPAQLLIEVQNPASELIELEPEPTLPPAPHHLLAELGKVSKRYDHLQRAFRDCHLALESLKASLASSSASKTLTQSVGLPKEILDAAVGRLDDYTEDVRVELEIKVGDEELLAKGYEALLSVPGALSSSSTKNNTGGDDDDPPTQSEAEAQIQSFVSGSDPAVRKARETFKRKLGDVQHDIAQLKRAVHDPESLLSPPSAPPVSAPDLSSTSSLTSPQPTKSDTGGWTSWIRGSPSTSRPSSPAPPTTFGNIMTNPRLRHSPSLGAGQLQGQSNGHGYSNDHQQQQVQDSRSRRGSFFGLNLGGGEKEKSTDPLTSLGLRVPMPSFASFSSFNPANAVSPPPSSSSSPFGFGAFHSAVSPTFNYGGLGAGAHTPTRTRTVSTMYMLGLSSPGSATGPGRMSRSVSSSGLGSPLGMSRQTSLSSQSSRSVAKKGAEREVKRVGEEVGEETDEDESEDDEDLDVE